MAELKVNVGDPKAKTTHTFTISEEDRKATHGKKLGDSIRGELIGKPGYELLITGGSDNAGFPMRADVDGGRRRKVLITKSTGNQKTEKGVRIRKTVAGNTVYEATSQLNVKVMKHGKDPLAAPAEEPAEEGAAEEEKAEDKPKEEAPEVAEKKEEQPKEDAPAEKEETPKEEAPQEKADEKPSEDKDSEKPDDAQK